MIKAVSFDFDHTLYDRDKTYENMVDDFMVYFAAYLRPDATRSEVLGVMQACDRSGIYKAGHWEGIYDDTLKSGIFAVRPTYETYYDGFMEGYYPGAIVLYDDTIPTLQKLRALGCKVSILTNGPSDYQRDKIGRVKLDRYVDCVLVGGELPHGKPHHTAFEAVCRAMGSRPGETAYVGDNPVNDVDGARRAGLVPIWMRSVGTWDDSLAPAPYGIDRLCELPALLETINHTLAAAEWRRTAAAKQQ